MSSPISSSAALPKFFLGSIPQDNYWGLEAQEVSVGRGTGWMEGAQDWEMTSNLMLGMPMWWGWRRSKIMQRQRSGDQVGQSPGVQQMSHSLPLHNQSMLVSFQAGLLQGKQKWRAALTRTSKAWHQAQTWRTSRPSYQQRFDVNMLQLDMITPILGVSPGNVLPMEPHRASYSMNHFACPHIPP